MEKLPFEQEIVGDKRLRTFSPDVDDEDNTRGSTRELTEDLRSELNNLKPSRTVSADDEEDDTLSYFARLAEE